MPKQLTSFLTLFLSCIILSGCGINASIDPMTYTYPSSKKPVNTGLSNNINVKEVTGGHTVSPLILSEISNENYKAALEKSLQNSKLYSSVPSANYLLSARILRIERPMLGLDLKTTLSVNYHLSRNGKNIYDKTIVSAYTAKFNDSLIAATRLKLANEGAARENIKQLMSDLYKL